MSTEIPATPKLDLADQSLRVSVDGGKVLLQGPEATTFALTPETAEHAAELLFEAARRARAESSTQTIGQTGRKGPPPFPPAELVSPHGAA